MVRCCPAGGWQHHPNQVGRAGGDEGISRCSSSSPRARRPRRATVEGEPSCGWSSCRTADRALQGLVGRHTEDPWARPADDAPPGLILNNFSTRLGRIGRMLGCLVPHDQFRGRQVVTLHNQRDFIFFRYHRYVFEEKGERQPRSPRGCRSSGRASPSSSSLYSWAPSTRSTASTSGGTSRSSTARGEVPPVALRSP